MKTGNGHEAIGNEKTRSPWLRSMRHALCTLRIRRGAAAGENPADRIPNWFASVFAGGSQRGISARAAELGYVEGKNIVIEWRSYEGHIDRQRASSMSLCDSRWT